MRDVEILKAEPGDALLLTEIALEAKRHWRYPESWIQFWKSDLSVSRETILRDEVLKAVFSEEVIGFYALKQVNNRLELTHMWVRPGHIGTGVGRQMFTHAVSLARTTGAIAFYIESDPNAEGFYLHMGAQRIGTITSSVEGHKRELPLLRMDLPH